MKRFLFAVTLLVLCSSAEYVNAKMLYERNVGTGKIVATTNDDTGDFNACFAAVPYNNGIILTQLIDSDFNWFFAFRHKLMSYNKSPEIAFSIDGGETNRAAAFFGSQHVLVVALAKNTRLFHAMRQGRTLRLSAQGHDFTIDLTKASKATDALFPCLRKYAANANSNPFIPATSAQTMANSPDGVLIESSPEIKSEASILTANVLAAAGIKGFRIIPPDEVPRELRHNDAVWFAEGVAGTVNVALPGVVNTIDQLPPTIIARDARACTGGFVSAKLEKEQGGTLRLMTGCDQAGKITKVNYTIVTRHKGGFYVFSFLGAQQTEQASQGVEERFMDAAMRVVTPR